MVRTYKKKRESTVNEDDVQIAVFNVVNGVMKLRRAADVYGLTPSTLFYGVKKYKENIAPKSELFSSKYTVAQVFTNAEEKMLEKYLLVRSRMNYGLTYKSARSLAYEYATALNKCPEKWINNRQAGIEWMKGFMKRHKNLSLRKPENTSLSRSTSFNKHTVSMFYDNYERVLQKTRFTPDRIYNLDETNIMTVVQAPNVIAQTGLKEIGQCVSAERGQLITMCSIVSATGNTVPPVFIFPRARFHDSMLNGAPPGSVGYANSPKSGWMTGPLFVKVLQHIKKITRCNKDDKILLLFDNHESHCTLDAINFCRDNGIVVVTFPPHCSHRMQPLDVAVNGPFKQKIAVAQNDWLLEHPGRTITIHDLPAIVTLPYNCSHTPNNIISGFSKPGIYPFNRNAFTDDDFLCAEVTNRPQIENEYSTPVNALPVNPDIQSTVASLSQMLQNVSPGPEETDQRGSPTIFNESLIVSNASPEMSDILEATGSLQRGAQTPLRSPGLENTDHIICDRSEHNTNETTSKVPGPVTPEIVMPYPKAPHKMGTKGRKKGSSRILTDTPEKNIIEAVHLNRMKNLEKSALRPRTKGGMQRSKWKQSAKGTQLPKVKSKPKKKSIFTSSSESDDHMSLNDDTDLDATDASDNEDEELQDPGKGTLFTSDSLNVGDYVLVQCPSEKQAMALAIVATIEERELNTFNVNYLKRKGDLFYFPEKNDRWSITILDVLAKLPAPNNTPGTSRTAAKFISISIFLVFAWDKRDTSGYCKMKVND